MLINRLKVVKDLILQKLDSSLQKLDSSLHRFDSGLHQLEHRLLKLESLEENVAHLTENDTVFLESFIEILGVLREVKQQNVELLERRPASESIPQFRDDLQKVQRTLLGEISHQLKIREKDLHTFLDTLTPQSHEALTKEDLQAFLETLTPQFENTPIPQIQENLQTLLEIFSTQLQDKLTKEDLQIFLDGFSSQLQDKLTKDDLQTVLDAFTTQLQDKLTKEDLQTFLVGFSSQVEDKLTKEDLQIVLDTFSSQLHDKLTKEDLQIVLDTFSSQLQDKLTKEDLQTFLDNFSSQVEDKLTKDDLQMVLDTFSSQLQDKLTKEDLRTVLDTFTAQLQEILASKEEKLLARLQSVLKVHKAAIVHHVETLLKQEESFLQQMICKLNSNDTAKDSNSEIKLLSGELPEPDVRLMKFLYSFLPSRVAVDIGANVGNVSEQLLKVGYQVYAFEPYSPSFDKLVARLAKYEGFCPSNYAIGSHNGTMELYVANDVTEQGFFKEPSLYNTLLPHSMPEGLKFTDKVPVPVRSIDSLQEKGELPQNIGLLKIDAEGYDLEIIHGLQNNSIPVIVTEFWDDNHIFAKFDAFNNLAHLVEEMKKRQYYWYIVFTHVERNDNHDFVYDVYYYCNCPNTLVNSWGNVFFFNNYDLFKKSLDWCSAVIPMAYF